MKKKDLNILFIGNSHTYYNDMPRLVKLRADEEGYSCRVTMLAHPNWFLSQHAEEPEARFNILHGKYDYVVLQEHAHPFGPEEEFLNSAIALNKMIREAGSTPVIYECWASVLSSHRWAKTGGPIKKAGQTWKCMTRMAHMPPTQDRISQRS